jgi:hypothetical protein
MKFMKNLTLLGSVFIVCAFAFGVQAAVTLTPATGGSAIPADRTALAFTSLTGPVLTEGATGDIAAGTIELNAPSGFEFDSTATVTVAVNSVGGTGNDIVLDSSTAVVTASKITVQVTSPSDGTKTSVLTWTGIAVRPTAGTPLASDTISESGTATFILDSTPPDNYGALSEVAGTVTALAFTTQPGSATAGAAFGTQPVIVTRDQFGNPSTSGLAANLNVTLSLAAGTGPLQGTTTQDIGTTAGNGTATFTDLQIDVAGTDKQLTAAASDFTSAASAVFAVNHATAASLVIQQQPSSSATAGAAFAQQPILLVEDAFGNLVDDDNSTVVTAVRNAGSGTLQGTLNATVFGGVATYTDLSHNVAGNISITFSSGSLSSVTSSAIAVSPAAADRLVFTAQPGSATAGSAFGAQPSLLTQDQFGNASTVGLPANLDVTMSISSGTGTLQGTTTQDIGTSAGNGSVSFTNLRIDAAGAKQLTASASGLTSATSASFTVNHATASALAMQQQPSTTATAGVIFAQQPIVQIVDAFGNLITEDNSTVITAARNTGVGTLQGTLNQKVSGGVATYTNLSHNVATNITIKFTSGSLSQATSSTVSVSPTTADHLVFSTQPGIATAGAVFGVQPVVNSQDQYGNASAVGLPSSLSVTVVLSAGTGPLQGTTTMDIGAAAGNGMAAFTDLRIDVSGSDKQLTASASGLTSANSAVFSVIHAAASKLTIQQQPSPSAVAGVAFAQQPIVRIEDSFGNLIKENNSSVITAVRNAGTGTLQGTVARTVSGGVATFTDLSHNVASTISITFSTGSLTSATSDPIVVGPGAADRLVFTAQPGSATAGSVFGSQPALITQDQFGNASSIGLPANLNVALALSSGTGPLQGTTTQDIGTLAGNGSVTFTNLRIDAAGTGKQLTASASGLSSATSTTFSVAHGSATQLLITSQSPTNAVAGEVLTNQPIVQISDSYGNVIDEDNSTHVVASIHGGGTGLDGGLDIVASSGVATFTNLSFEATGDFTLDFTATSLASATSSNIHVDSGAPASLTIETQPGSTATAGQNFLPQPVIAIRDAFGNLCVTDNVTQVTVDQIGGNDLLGTTNITAVNGIVSFTNLAETLATSIELIFSSAALPDVVSDPIDVQPGPVSQLVIHTQPSPTVIAGQNFPDQPVIWLEDAYGNLCVNDSTTAVTVSRVNGVGNLQGTTTLQAVNGVVTYTDLKRYSATSMNLQFTTGAITATSDLVTVLPGPATQIIFTQQPDNANAGRVFGTQPIVQVADDYGNLPSNLANSVPITISLSSGTGYLFGTKTVDAGADAGGGFATFEDLQINAFGNKRLTASAAGFTNALSETFTNVGTIQPLGLFGSNPIGGTPNSMWVGNFRGAATARDVVVANHDAKTLTVRLSKDDGTFDSAATISLPAHPIAVRAADFDRDGYDDLVVAYDDTNVVQVFLSTGSHGTNFAVTASYLFSALPNPQATAMFVTDLNGDGKQDVIVASAADDNVNILFATGVAALTSPVAYGAGGTPAWIQVADLNRDGFQDIITANFNDGTISILHGAAGADYSTVEQIQLDGDPQPIRVTTPDINRDGRLDLAVVNYASNTVSVLLQQANGDFLLSSNYTVGTHPTDFFLRDLDGDGFSDLAVLNAGSGTMDILFNRGTSNYVSQATIAVGQSPASMFGGKFVSSMNMNGLVVADAASSDVSTFVFSGPIALNSTNNVNENSSTTIILGARNQLFPQIFHFVITQYPTNGTVTGTPPNMLYTPDEDYIGVDCVKFRADGNGVTSAVASVTINVQSVNHQPSFTMATNLVRLLQGSSYTLKNFITSRDPGAPAETSQKMDFIVTNVDSTLYATAPKIGTNGTLTFKLAPLARGTNDLVIYAHDNGGTARGGVNTSVGQTLRIVALRYDHAPVVKAIAPVTILEDSAGTNITFSVSDLDDPMENISVTATSLNESIIPTSNIEVTGPVDTNFTVAFVPAPDANGVATIQLAVFDGQETTLAKFSVTVTAVNDAPEFTLPESNVYALEDSATVTINNFCTGVWAGAANETAQTLTFVVDNTNHAAWILPPAIDKYGTLKFRPALGYVGTNYFNVHLKDSGGTLNGGVNVSVPQTFCVMVTTNNFRHLAGTYNGLFYEDTGVSHNSSGFVTFTLGYTRSFSGKVLIEGGTYPISGVFDTNGFVQATIKRLNKSNLIATMQVDLEGDSDQVNGDVTDGQWDATLLADRQASAPAAGTVGKFNAVFAGNGDGITSLGGDAIGLVTLTSANKLTFTGTLPDKTLLSQTVGLSKNGVWPLYVPLYAGAGSMIGWVTATNDTQPLQTEPNGVSVIKVNNNRYYYPTGFTNQFTLKSSAAVPFEFVVPVISQTGTLTFSGANLSSDLVGSYTMTANNVFLPDTSPNKFKLTFDKTTGYLNGSFVHPDTHLITTFKGLLLPNANSVQGYFYTPTQTGEFKLQGD